MKQSLTNLGLTGILAATLAISGCTNSKSNFGKNYSAYEYSGKIGTESVTFHNSDIVNPLSAKTNYTLKVVCKDGTSVNYYGDECSDYILDSIIFDIGKTKMKYDRTDAIGRFMLDGGAEVSFNDYLSKINSSKINNVKDK